MGKKILSSQLTIFAALLALFGAASCGKQASAPQPVAPAEAPSDSVVLLPENLAALVTFISGRVERVDSGKQEEVEIGDNLPVKTMLHVFEDSYCELQFGNTAILRVNGGSEISLERIALETLGNQVEAKLASGSVYAKVAKLGAKDKFQIRTQVAVCGVRGTEFSVVAARNGNTVLRVKEGKVAVLPAAADKRVTELPLPQSVESNAIIEATASSLMLSAPIVSQNQEIELTAEMAGRTEAGLKKTDKVISSLAGAASSTPQAAEESARKIADTIAEAAFTAFNAPKTMSPESTEALEVINAMNFVSLPEQRTVEDTTKQENKQKKLSTITLSVVPEDAEIYLNGSLIAVGNLQQVVEEETQLKFEIRRQGYEPQEISAQAKTARVYEVKLQPRPKEISIVADPKDAEILIDGQSVGFGTYRGSFAVGKEIAIGLKKPGYAEKTFTYTVALESQPEIAISLNKTSKEVSVSVTPADAKISLNGKAVSTGTFQTIKNVGDKLQITIVRSGYKERTIDLIVKEADDENSLKIDLERLTKTITISADPVDSTITLNGAVHSGGRITETFAYGTVVTALVAKDGYETQSITVPIDDSTSSPPIVRLQKLKKQVSIQAIPQDASIIINGKHVGNGSFKGDYPLGESLDVAIQSEGFLEKKVSLNVDQGLESPIRIQLEAKAIIARVKATASKVIGIAAGDNDWLFVSDSNGAITALTDKRNPAWSVQTANKPNETTPPVVFKDLVIFTGTKELVVINAKTGNLAARKPLDASSSNLFGRKPISADGRLYLPTNQAILEIDPADGKTLRTLKIASDTMMTPTYEKGNFLIADQLGKVYSINAESGAENYTVPTQALQGVAQAIQIVDSQAYFAGRRGNVVSFDPQSGKVNWQTKLNDPNAAVFSDLICADGKILVFSRNTIYTLNASNGQQLLPPMKDVSSTPMLIADTIFFGTNSGDFTAFDSVTKAMRSIRIGAKATTAVRVQENRVALGTDTGEILIINPQGIK